MVDLTDQFKGGSDPAVTTPAASSTTSPAPTPDKKPDQTTSDLNVSFIKAGDTGMVINPEPGKKSIFSRQVVTPAFKAPKPDK